MTADAPRDDPTTLVQARLFRALGHPSRLAIVRALADGERSVQSLQATVGSDLSTVSRHLSQLTAAGVLASRRDGRHVLYRLRTECVLAVMRCVAAILAGETTGGQAVAPEACAGCATAGRRRDAPSTRPPRTVGRHPEDTRRRT